jgi:hypothetical protein
MTSLTLRVSSSGAVLPDAEPRPESAERVLKAAQAHSADTIGRAYTMAAGVLHRAAGELEALLAQRDKLRAEVVQLEQRKVDLTPPPPEPDPDNLPLLGHH